jgi:hypothetical protein
VIEANLATVEAHFHDEALNEIEKVCAFYTDDIVWAAPLETVENAAWSQSEQKNRQNTKFMISR